MLIFFLPAHAITPPSITVPRDLLAHLRDSLRVEAGEEIIFADGQGTRYRTEITHSSKQGIAGRIIETMHEPLRQAPAVILGQALLKGEKMDRHRLGRRPVGLASSPRTLATASPAPSATTPR